MSGENTRTFRLIAPTAKVVANSRLLRRGRPQAGSLSAGFARRVLLLVHAVTELIRVTELIAVLQLIAELVTIRSLGR